MNARIFKSLLTISVRELFTGLQVKGREQRDESNRFSSLKVPQV
jgi:hypothetical protein